MILGDHSFLIPFTYAFKMIGKDGIQMLIGCNFIRSMGGGLRIEGRIVTFYKNVTQLETVQHIQKYSIPELEMDADEYRKIQEK